MSFTGKVVIVTGGSSGIGAATAIDLTKQGANVVIAARTQANLNAVAAECEKYGAKPLVVNADLVNDLDCKRIIDETVKAYGKIDVLVNNAGSGVRKPFGSDNDLNIFDRVLSLNLRAVVQLTHLAVPYLEETKGNVVNVSSLAAVKTSLGDWAYCTSKAALDHFSRCIASELAPKGIRVNVVNPGPVNTNVYERVENKNSYIKQLVDATVLKRFNEPQEIADIISFLASDKAKGVTGASWVVDNGMQVKC